MPFIASDDQADTIEQTAPAPAAAAPAPAAPAPRAPFVAKDAVEVPPEEAAKDLHFDPDAHFQMNESDGTPAGDARQANALEYAAKVKDLHDRGFGPKKSLGDYANSAWEGTKEGAKLVADQGVGMARVASNAADATIGAAVTPIQQSRIDSYDKQANDPTQPDYVRAAAKAKADEIRGTLSKNTARLDREGAESAAALEASSLGALGMVRKVAKPVGRALESITPAGADAQAFENMKASAEGRAPADLTPKVDPLQRHREGLIDNAAMATARKNAVAGKGTFAEATGQASPDELAKRGEKFNAPDLGTAITGSTPVEQMSSAASPEMLALGPALEGTGAVLSQAAKIPVVGPAVAKGYGKALDATGAAARQIPGRILQATGKGVELAGDAAASEVGSKVIAGGVGLAGGHSLGHELIGGYLGTKMSSIVKGIGSAVSDAGEAVKGFGKQFAEATPDTIAGAAGDIVGGGARAAADFGVKGVVTGSPLAALDDDPVKSAFSNFVPGIAFGTMGAGEAGKRRAQAAADTLAQEGAVHLSKASQAALSDPSVTDFDRRSVQTWTGILKRLNPNLEIEIHDPQSFAQEMSNAYGHDNPGLADIANARGVAMNGNRILINAGQTGMFGVAAHEGGHSLFGDTVSRVMGESIKANLSSGIDSSLFAPAVDANGIAIPGKVDYSKPTPLFAQIAKTYGDNIGRSYDLSDPHDAQTIRDEFIAETSRALTENPSALGKFFSGPQAGQRGLEYLRDRLGDIIPSMRPKLASLDVASVPKATIAVRSALYDLGTVAREGLSSRTPGTPLEEVPGASASQAAKVKAGGSPLAGVSTAPPSPAAPAGASPMATVAPSPAPAAAPAPAPGVSTPQTPQSPAPAPAAAAPVVNSTPPQARADAIKALVAIGYSKKDAQFKVDAALADGTPFADAGAVAKAALASGYTPPAAPIAKDTSGSALKPSASVVYNDDVMPISAHVLNGGGIRPLPRNKGEARLYKGGEYDGWEALDKSVQARMRGTMDPDEAHKYLIDAGLLPENSSVDDMWAAIEREHASARTQFEQGREGEGNAKAGQAFHDEIGHPKEGDVAVHSGDLRVGDQMLVDGTVVTVRNIDPDTMDVHVDGGGRYGQQVIPDGQRIFIQKHIPAPEEGAAPKRPAAGRTPMAEVGGEGEADPFARKDDDVVGPIATAERPEPASAPVKHPIDAARVSAIKSMGEQAAAQINAEGLKMRANAEEAKMSPEDKAAAIEVRRQKKLGVAKREAAAAPLLAAFDEHAAALGVGSEKDTGAFLPGEKTEEKKSPMADAGKAERPKYDGLTARTFTSRNIETGEETTRKIISGRRIDPADPLHAHVLEANNVPAERAETFNAAIAAGRPLLVDYNSAKAEGEVTAVSRAKEQKVSSAKDRLHGETEAENQTKTIYPSSFRLAKDGTLDVTGFDADKFNSNAQRILDHLKAERPDLAGEIPFDSINSAAYSTAARQYAENHAHGYRGDGSAPVQGTEASPIAVDADYHAVKLPEPVANLLNMAYGDSAAKSPAAGGAAARDLAKANERLPADYSFPRDAEGKPIKGAPVADVNPLRAAIGDALPGIESTTSNLKLGLVDDARPATDAPTQAGMRQNFGGNPARQFAGGTPLAKIARAGFLPAEKELATRKNTDDYDTREIKPARRPLAALADEKRRTDSEVPDASRGDAGKGEEGSTGEESAAREEIHSPESWRSALEGGTGDVPKDSWDAGPSIADQRRRIVRLAESAGRVVAEAHLAHLKDVGSAEHNVAFDGDNNRWYKATSEGRYGYVPAVTARGELTVDDGTPLTYARRMELQNSVFGDDIRMEGVGDGGKRIVISQPNVDGVDPTPSEVHDFMKSKGFALVDEGQSYYRAKDNVLAMDADTKNFRKRPDGTISPIDLIMSNPHPDMVAAFQRYAEKNPPFGYAPDQQVPVPERRETLDAQIDQLKRGLRPAVMVTPGGHDPGTPDGMERVKTPNGEFIYDPAKIDADKIKKLDAAGRQNEFLNLGPESKADVLAAGGEPLGVREVTPDGVEVRSALVSAGKAKDTASEFEGNKTPGNKIAIDHPLNVIADRMLGDDKGKFLPGEMDRDKALKLVKKLNGMKSRGERLDAAQSQTLAAAEKALGQGELFGDEKAGGDLKLEQESTSPLAPIGKKDDGQGALFLPADAKEQKDLLALHNTNAAGLLATERIGGIPAPSLAVTKEGHPFFAFGDVTLVGDRSMIDPQVDARNKVFDSDIYSMRQPRPDFKIDRKAVDKVIKEFSKLRPDWYQFDPSAYSELQSIVNRGRGEGNQQRATDESERSAMFRQAFAEEKTGKQFEPVMRPKPANTAYTDTKAFRDFANSLTSDQVTELRHASPADPMWKKLTEVANASLEEIETTKNLKLHDPVDELSFNAGHRFIRDLDLVRNPEKEQDRNATRSEVDKVIAKHGSEFEKWVEDKLAPIFHSPEVMNRRKREQYNLENVTDAMTGPQVRGREGGATHSLGKSRSMAAKQFDSIAQVKAKASRLVNDQDFEDRKGESSDLFHAAVNLIGDAYSNSSQFEKLDDASKALGDYLKGPKTGSGMIRAMARNYFDVSKLSDEAIEALQDAAQALRDMPTEYFEAKPQRAVKLNEFKGAVVPKETDPAVIAKLKARGLDVATYEGREDRWERVNAMAEKHGAKFLPSGGAAASPRSSGRSPLASVGGGFAGPANGDRKRSPLADDSDD